MFSRLIVKGLPGNCTEAKLRSVFDSYGNITDCSLKYTKDGKFRRFAYVGFSEEGSASKALKHLDNTHIGSSKIKVEVCRPFGDPCKPRAWSKYSKESRCNLSWFIPHFVRPCFKFDVELRLQSAYKRAHLEEGSDTVEKVVTETVPIKKPKFGDEKKFDHFLKLHGEGVRESASDDSKDPSENLVEQLLQEITGNTSLSLVLYNLSPSIKKKTLKDWLSPSSIKGLKIVRNAHAAAAFVTFTNPGDVEEVQARNGEFLGGVKVLCYSFSFKILSLIIFCRFQVAVNRVSDIDNSKNEEKLEDVDVGVQEVEMRTLTNAILDTGRLFVRNLPYTCTEDDLQFLFKKYGEIAEIQFIINKKTRRSKGFAIVTYVFPENAVNAYSALDGTIFKGRMLHILPGNEKRVSHEEAMKSEVTRSAFQKEKLAKLKAVVGKAHSWNTLFLGANAVADTFAARLDVTKSELLGDGGETSAGVRVALAETQLVRETRDFLISNGVHIDAFSQPASKRSDTIIIVKNLPANTDVDELKRMFGRYGLLNRVLMPPGGISAVVEMDNTVDARKAFIALAYSRFRSQPLYLEWAPIDIFKKGAEAMSSSKELLPEDTKGKNELQSKVESQSKKRMKRQKTGPDITEGVEEELANVSDGVRKANVKDMESDDENEVEAGVGTTIFVKNLNFSTTEGSLRLKFASKYKVKSAVISKKLDTKNPSTPLSMGFGFVRFFRKSDAKDAVRTMQGTLLDGHCLELKLSNRDDSEGKIHARKTVFDLEQKERTKIHIKNISFQASRAEVKQLFAAFGEIRAFRMPRKVIQDLQVGGGAEEHRGFGFVDYLTRGDARRAFKQLSHSTHLYGKRIVLEWAKAEENVEEMREKALLRYSKFIQDSGPFVTGWKFVGFIKGTCK
ncbi:unnamed protein product [Enterobius vermicularis]|uniref:RNA-binding protein 19 n=1 Tax=Enterobius vermicularis TaxID=51028 RepID=A0A0N4V1M2_ENTVE|nr:unnamed protein product [Enterobius vermicularis]